MRATFANKRRGIKAAGTVGHKHHVQYSIGSTLKKTCFLSLSKKKGLNRYFDVTFPLYPLLPKPFENFLHSHKNANVRKDFFSCGVWENPVLSHLFFFFFRESVGGGSGAGSQRKEGRRKRGADAAPKKRFLFSAAAKGIRRGKQYLTDMSGSYGD